MIKKDIKKISGNEYADDISYAVKITEKDKFATRLIEFHKYECIDKSDENFGNIKTVVAYKDFNEHFQPASFVNAKIYDFDLSSMNSIGMIIDGYTIIGDETMFIKFQNEFYKNVDEGNDTKFLIKGI